MITGHFFLKLSWESDAKKLYRRLKDRSGQVMCSFACRTLAPDHHLDISDTLGW